MNGKCLYKRCRKHDYCYVNFCWFCIKDYLHIKEEDKYTRLITIKEKTDFLNKYPLGCVGECVEVNKERKYCKEELSNYVKEQLIISEKIKDDLARKDLSYVTNTWLNNWLDITIKEFLILIEDETNKQLLHDLQCTGLIQEKDVQEEIEKLKTENKQLRDKINYATGYVANILMEHNVSGEYIMNYVATYGDKNDWVNAVYLKELFGILAKPSSSVKPKEMENK